MSEEKQTQPIQIVSELDKQYRTEVDQDEKDLHSWAEKEFSSEHIKAEEEKIETDFRESFDQVKKDFNEFTQSELFKETAEAGKEFFGNLGSMICEGWKYGFSRLVQVEPFTTLDQLAKQEIKSLKSNSQLKDFVFEAEEKLEAFNQDLFSKLDDFFHGQDQLPARIYTFKHEDTDEES